MPRISDLAALITHPYSSACIYRGQVEVSAGEEENAISRLWRMDGHDACMRGCLGSMTCLARVQDLVCFYGNCTHATNRGLGLHASIIF